ncbi:hypothetical protein J0H58_32445, partial [bacterium]|nr:hypothetical protein [bacterium]
GRLPRPVGAGDRLDDLIGAAVTGARWAAAERRLGCPLPPVRFEQGHWFLPDEFQTVWDVADHVARHRPDWEPPAARTAAAWREAQVFAGVREVLVEAGNLDAGEVTRPARLRHDLRLE